MEAMTLSELIATAEADFKASRFHIGKAISGRFEVRVVDVGRPSTGLDSGATIRRDFYLDGKRVSRAKLIAAMA